MSKSLLTAIFCGLFTLVSTAQETDSIPSSKNQETEARNRKIDSVSNIMNSKVDSLSSPNSRQVNGDDQNKIREIDSLQGDLKNEGIVVVDTLVKKKVRINPLAPSKAAFYSAVIPGLGQIYNKRYWKAPIVWGAIGGAIYAYTWNDNAYQRFRTAFKRRQAGFFDDEFFDLNGDGAGPDQGLDDLQSQQERFQRDRDLWLLVSVGLYALNIVDANVDAHLKQFNVDQDLSLDMRPYFDMDPVTNQPVYGMAVAMRF